MKHVHGLALAVFLAVPVLVHAEPAPELVWRPVEIGYGCSAAVSTNQPREGKGALELRTQSANTDPGAWFAFVRTEVKRKDGQPLGLLAGLAEGGSLTLDLFRHPDSGDGMPDFTLPWVALRVRNPDGEEAVLLWESCYNGWKKMAREGEWLDDVKMEAGTYWMRYQGRNYNGGKGFQSLKAYAGGTQAVSKEMASLKLAPAAQVMVVEVGSGPNLPGLLLAYVDDIRLSFAGGLTYRFNFEP